MIKELGFSLTHGENELPTVWVPDKSPGKRPLVTSPTQGRGLLARQRRPPSPVASPPAGSSPCPTHSVDLPPSFPLLCFPISASSQTLLSLSDPVVRERKEEKRRRKKKRKKEKEEERKIKRKDVS
jgi:hypothetical protein